MKEITEWLGSNTELSHTILRLVIAAVLGGVIGLEREIKHKPAGLRTNLFICLGAAMFTILSFRLANMYPGDHTRIAAQIIPGIGFIGAGSILHSRGSVQGLTTAATLFVVASVGMATGGGLYGVAVFATLLILVSLAALGWAEGKFSLKPLLMTYEVIGADADNVVSGVNQVLEDERRCMRSVQVARTDHQFRVQFSVDATQREHDALLKRLRQLPVVASAQSLGLSEDHE